MKTDLISEFHKRIVFYLLWLFGTNVAFCSICFGTDGNLKNFDAFIHKDKQTFDNKIEVLAELEPSSVRLNETTLLILNVRVHSGFHIYSVQKQGEFGPEPTTLQIIHSGLKPIGDTIEPMPTTVIDKAFDTPLKVHKNEFWLKQRYRLTKSIRHGYNHITGHIKYQICNNKVCSLLQTQAFETGLQVRNIKNSE